MRKEKAIRIDKICRALADKNHLTQLDVTATADNGRGDSFGSSPKKFRGEMLIKKHIRCDGLGKELFY